MIEYTKEVKKMADYSFLDDLKYTESHEWVKVDGDVAIVGITDYAQHQLGDIVFVEPPAIGDSVEKGSVTTEIESVKAVGELMAPVSGEIVEFNEKIEEAPEIVNQSPYEDGWLVKIKMSDSGELDDLLPVGKYKDIVAAESH